MIRQIICGREPPERFKRQTTHGGRFVLFPLFPPTPLALRHDPPWKYVVRRQKYRSVRKATRSSNVVVARRRP